MQGLLFELLNEGQVHRQELAGVLQEFPGGHRIHIILHLRTAPHTIRDDLPSLQGIVTGRPLQESRASSFTIILWLCRDPILTRPFLLCYPAAREQSKIRC